MFSPNILCYMFKHIVKDQFCISKKMLFDILDLPCCTILVISCTFFITSTSVFRPSCHILFMNIFLHCVMYVYCPITPQCGKHMHQQDVATRLFLTSEIFMIDMLSYKTSSTCFKSYCFSSSFI